ncbi:MAG TPA: GGDEF domain-containing protein, partial [Chitinolyticbacter sp.]|nr:GGDEF domain-containing protein [Chitinolyticbacter sp.]
DHFKTINDRFGHERGDDALRHVAQLLRDTVRDSDVIARWGGEEFVVLLKDCPLDEAMRLAELLRNWIAGETLADEAPLSASLGVAQYQDDELPEHYFARLDAALRRAKALGRNGVAAG